MFRLLVLVTTALAAPQYPFYPQYAGYSNMGLYGLPMYNPVYGTVMRQGLYQPAAYIPVVQTGPPTVQAVSQNQNTRSIISFQNLQQINQRFVAATTAQIAAGTHTAAQVIVGTVQITQNLVTDFLNGNDASYKINIQSGGPPAGQNIILGLAADCMTPATAGLTPDVRFATVSVPPLPWISGRTTGFNINGLNGKTTLRGRRLQILNAAGTDIIGCTEADLF